jgi:hypothetical protein
MPARRARARDRRGAVAPGAAPARAEGLAVTAALEIIAAVVFAKYGGGLLVSYDEGGEKLLGWACLLVGVAVAVRAGTHF